MNIDIPEFEKLSEDDSKSILALVKSPEFKVLLGVFNQRLENLKEEALLQSYTQYEYIKNELGQVIGTKATEMPVAGLAEAQGVRKGVFYLVKELSMLEEYIESKLEAKKKQAEEEKLTIKNR